MVLKRGGWTIALVLLLVGCALHMPPGPGPTVPALQDKALVTSDGTPLPLRRWEPPAKSPQAKSPQAKSPQSEKNLRGVILAVHGFNDYAEVFDLPASWFAERGFLVYAYDQRGFGRAPHAGLGAGTGRMAEDLSDALRLIRRRHPDRPLFVLGDSMGGALAVVTLSRPEAPEVDGVMLSAPAVWGRYTMPFYQRATLWIVENFFPWVTASGRGLKIQASDNIEALIKKGRDPLVIKKTKAVAISGLTDLMTEALTAAPDFRARALVLYGKRDEIIPAEPTLLFWRGLPAACAQDQHKALYRDGWHMLLHDLQREVVYRDMLHWMEAGDGPLPSGMDRDAEARLAALAEVSGDAAAGAEASPGEVVAAACRGLPSD